MYDENYSIKVGKNAQNNWDILNEADPTDYFLHLSSFPSCFVILKADEQIGALIRTAAELCKENTKYKNVPNIKVDYCLCSNVVIEPRKTGLVSFRSNRAVKKIAV